MIDALIAELRRAGPVDSDVVVGIGDDTAVARVEAGLGLFTVDALVEGTHFKRSYLDWEGLGWKALAVNLSDIAAMGGAPRYALVSLVLPEGENRRNVVRAYHGLAQLAGQAGLAVLGGNVSRGSDLALHITVFGQALGGDRIMTRSAARAGDVVCVTGTLGGAAAGLKCLEDRKIADAGATGELVKAFWRPCPRLDTGRLLAEEGVRCAIDISDGLLADIGHVLTASGVGARLHTELIPVNPDAVAVQGKLPALQSALSGGEDYELLFTAPEPVVAGIIRNSEVPVTRIGETTPDSGRIELVDESGNPVSYLDTGWRHF